MDVELRQKLWENVSLLNKRGVTVILTTHYIEEAEKMCDRVGILNKGNLIALDTTKNLLDRIQTKKVTIKTNRQIEVNDNELISLKLISNFDNSLQVSYEKSKTNMEELIQLIKKKKCNNQGYFNR